jgi:hypothetical protein
MSLEMKGKNGPKPDLVWDALTLLSPLRLPVPPSRHFVEVIDSTANFAFYFVAIPNGKCETV